MQNKRKITIYQCYGQPKCTAYLAGPNITPVLPVAVRNRLHHALEVFDQAIASGATYEDAAVEGCLAVKNYQAADSMPERTKTPTHDSSHSGSASALTITISDSEEPNSTGGESINSQPSLHSSLVEKSVDIVIYLAVRFCYQYVLFVTTH